MTLNDAYQLLHVGNITLADIERNGIRIDTDYLKQTESDLKDEIKDLKDRLEKTELLKRWRKRFGRKFKWDGNNQIAEILFGKDEMNLDPPKETKTGLASTDEESLKAVPVPAIKGILKLRRKTKTLNTFIRGIMRETVDGFLHPMFKLHTTVTYRSSSSNPNFQNLPIRDPAMSKLIRSAFIPRKGRQLVEIDYSGIEVRVAACYHHDPRMINYICDPTKDMHRDMAGECFLVDPSRVSKLMRYCGKNMFVFPQFYGDYFGNCAKAQWAAIDSLELETTDGIPLREHLRKQGIRSLKSFTNHIEEVEDEFWNERFKVYQAWKDRHWQEYLKRGWFQMKTGFICQGLMGKNDAINYPVQGAAFHCLLWSLARIHRTLRRRKMKSMIVGQIHDSIVFDVVPEELEDLLDICRRIMTEDLLKAWDWIIVPLEIEVEVAPIDSSWFEKKETKLAA